MTFASAVVAEPHSLPTQSGGGPIPKDVSKDDILERARKLDVLTLRPTDIRRLSRDLRQLREPSDVRVALVGNVTFEPLPEFIEAHLACTGLTASAYVGPFDQALQELLDSSSALHRFDPTFIFAHFELDAFAPNLNAQAHTAEGALIAAARDVLDRLSPIVQAALNSTRATVLLTNFSGPESYDLGLADWRSDFSQQELFYQLNAQLAQRYRHEPRVHIVDLCRLTAHHGRSRARDRRLYYMAKMPWQEGFLPLLADEITRHIAAGLGRIRKCLVVDLDNTLWGGVLGEDGPQGVRVGLGDPIAEAHLDLQRRILAMKRRGVLLAICSKNNPADVDECFRLRTEMPLRKEDFACIEVGWDMKHEGLRNIAARLNIGTDSLVFLDDNPAELELIRQLLPEVQCVTVPSDPAVRASCLDRVHGLERIAITAEDLNKTQQYRDNAARDAVRHEFGNVHDYLRSLGTKITIAKCSSGLLARAHQLFSKTNQFNATTRRYTLGEVEQFASSSKDRLLIIRAEDRFGDIGWIGAVLLRNVSDAEIHIDSFILSCRAMGRGIETAVLNHLKAACFEQPQCVALTAEFIPTAKNAPAREFFDKHGFTIARADPDGAKHYRLCSDQSAPTDCDWIEVCVAE